MLAYKEAMMDDWRQQQESEEQQQEEELMEQINWLAEQAAQEDGNV